MPKAKNLRNAFLYIEENMNRQIRVEEVSRVSGYSNSQLYRLFQRYTGDTISEYIVRRKMSKAVIDLKESTQTIGEIALQYGFESHDVFTRAFIRVYGITPCRYRNSNVKLQPIKAIINQSNDAEKSNVGMSFSISELQSFDVIGMECEAALWDSDGAIGRLWLEFSNLYVNEKNKDPLTMYGICEYDTCKGDRMKYMAAVGMNDIMKANFGMVKRTIRKQKYFLVSVPKQIGTPDAYTIGEYYAKSLGYEMDETDWIEVYSDRYHDPEIHKFKLYIPIK